MDSVVFYTQLGLSILVCYLLAEWFLVPRLSTLTRSQALLVVLSPQAFRHFGLYALTLAAFEPHLPSAWANPVATGDMATQVTTLIAMLALRRGGRGGILWAWICTVIGLLDFSYSTYLTTRLGIPVHRLPTAWFLPLFFFPVVALGHWYSLRLLIRGRLGDASAVTAATSQ